MREQCGWQGQLLPKSAPHFNSTCEALFEHPVLQTVVANARAKFDKSIITVDGQWSSMLSVLYQHPHGHARPHEPNPAAPNKHVALSVRCPAAVLNVEAMPSEKLEYQLAVLRGAFCNNDFHRLRALGSDRPGDFDSQDTGAVYSNGHCTQYWMDCCHIVSLMLSRA